MFAGVTQGMPEILASRIREGAQSPYSTTELPSDSEIVLSLKGMFRRYEARNWGVTPEQLEQDFVTSGQQRKNPDQYLYARQSRNFGPGRGGLSIAEYNDYARALRAAYALDTDEDLASRIMRMAENITELYKELQPRSEAFEHHFKGQVDAIIGDFKTDPDGKLLYRPGIRSMHPEDLKREEAARKERESSGKPYVYHPRKNNKEKTGILSKIANTLPDDASLLKSFLIGSEKYIINTLWEPFVKKFIFENTTLLSLKIKNRFEGIWFGGFNRLKKERFREARQEDSPTHRFIEHSVDLLNTLDNLKRLMIQDSGREFSHEFNGTENSQGLQNHGFLLYEMLRIADPAILQCAKDHFTFRHTGMTKAQFIENYTEVAVKLYNVGFNPNTPDNSVNILEILYENGLHDPRIPQDIREAIIDESRLFIESKRQDAFNSLVDLAHSLPRNFADCYVFRSIVKAMEIPAFGNALRHLLESEIKLVGNDKARVEKSLQMIATLGPDMSSQISSIIEIYSNSFYLNTFLAQITNPNTIDQSKRNLSLEKIIRRYPDEILLLHDMFTSEMVFFSEWLENPNDNFEDFRLPASMDQYTVLAKRQVLEKIHGYGGFYKDIILCEANDNWGMNFLYRTLIEMNKLESKIKSNPTIDNISFAIDWQNKSVELLVGIIQRSPYLARQKNFISPNLKSKFEETLPKLKSVKEISWPDLIETLYNEVYNEAREKSRHIPIEISRGMIGPGFANFLFNPALTPAGGVLVRAGQTFCANGPDGKPRKDANGNFVFAAVEGYGYRPATYGHLSNSEQPLEWMKDENGKNALQYYRCSSQKTEQIFHWLNDKIRVQNKNRASRGLPPLRFFEPTDVMPMFAANHPDNPGIIGIGQYGSYAQVSTPWFSHGDTIRGQEFLPVKTGYYAKFNFMGGSTGMLDDPDLFDPTIQLASTAAFSTFSKTSQGEIVIEFARRGDIDTNGRFTTVSLFTAEISAACVKAFNSNIQMVLEGIAKKTKIQYDMTSSFIQNLSSYLKNIPSIIKSVSRDIYPENVRVSEAQEKNYFKYLAYPKIARQAMRATPRAGYTESQDVLDASNSFGRGQSHLPISIGLSEKFSGSNYHSNITGRIINGHKIIETTIAEKYIPAARLLGIPPEQAAYSVAPINSIGGFSVYQNNEPIEALFLSEGKIKEYSSEDPASILQKLSQYNLIQNQKNTR